MNTKRLIFVTIFIDLLGYGILIPVLPLLFTDQTSAYYFFKGATESGAGFLLLGVLIAVFPFGQFLSTPIIGQLSDRLGRRKLLFVSLLGTAAGYFLFAVGIYLKSVPLVLFSRFLDGITGGNIVVAQAVISDTTKKEDRASAFGIIGAAFGLGFILGPFLGGKLSSPDIISWFSPITPFIFAGLLAFLNALCIRFFLKETYIPKDRTALSWFQAFNNISHAFSSPYLKRLFTVNFFFTAGFTFFTTFFGVFLLKKFHFDESHIGNFFAYVGVCSVLVQGFILKKLTRFLNEIDILKVSLLGGAIMLFLYSIPESARNLYFLVPFFALFNGVSMALLPALISKRTPSDEQGKILGINASVQALAQTIPAIISGVVAQTISPFSTLFIASFIVFIAWIIFVFSAKSFIEIKSKIIT